MTTMRCPVCGKSFAAEQSDALPFCSQRCKQVDLGRWLGEVYSLPVEPEEEDSETSQGGENPPGAGP